MTNLSFLRFVVIGGGLGLVSSAAGALLDLVTSLSST